METRDHKKGNRTSVQMNTCPNALREQADPCEAALLSHGMNSEIMINMEQGSDKRIWDGFRFYVFHCRSCQ